MLSNVIGAYLDSLSSEREFDAPFVAILRTQGFYDIHCIHGSYEFGKDFIAKRAETGEVVQYTLQSKLGDIDKSTWERDVRPQAETMAFTPLGHPNLDSSCRQLSVVVITGDFKGQAATQAQTYSASRQERHLPPLVIWTKSELIEMVMQPACLLYYSDLAALLSVASQAKEGLLDVDDIEKFSRRWTNYTDPKNIWRAIVEAAVLGKELERNNLLLYAARVPVGLARAAALWREVQALSPEEQHLAESFVRRDIVRYGTILMGGFTDFHSSQKDIPLVGRHPLSILTCGARALRVGEVLALASLTDASWAESNRAAISDLLGLILSYGCSTRPLGDRFAYGILTLALAADALGMDVRAFLARTAVWVCDCHERDELGMAPVRSEPIDDLWHTVGSLADKPEISRRNESLLAAAVLDACSVLSLRDLYDDCINDFLAVYIIPHRIVPDKPIGEFMIGKEGCVIACYSGDYAEQWEGREGWMNSPLHERSNWPRRFDEAGASWIGVAMGALLRDRWWVYSLRQCYEDLQTAVSPPAPSGSPETSAPDPDDDTPLAGHDRTPSP